MVLGIAGCLAMAAGCGRSGERSSGTAPHAASTLPAPFENESQFIVQTIVSDLAEQMFFAANHRMAGLKEFTVRVREKAGSPLDAPVYNLEIASKTGEPARIELAINGPIWSPEVYEGVTAALAKTVGLKAPSAGTAGDTKLLAALTDANAGTIEKENQRISKELENDFTNPGLHEQAALVLGAFGLREHAGKLSDLHGALCRMTAHLAMASRLAGATPPTLNSHIADAMLFSLMNNQATALEKLDKIETTDVAAQQWIRALRAYNTGDYRMLSKMPALSPIERIVWFRAFARSVDDDVAWAKLTEKENFTTDFARIASEESFSVETGHQLLAVSVPSELKELAMIWGLSHGRKLQPAELTNVLNELPERGFTADGKVRIIGWGQWAGFLQRHLCHAIERDFHFMHEQWGVPEQAAEFATKCNQAFGGLRLYPFARRLMATDKTVYGKAANECAGTLTATPQLVPWACCSIWETKRFFSFASEMEAASNWHTHGLLPGTAYRPEIVFGVGSFMRRRDRLAYLHKLRERAPYDSEIAYEIFNDEYGRNPTYEEVEALYRPVLSFDTSAMTRVAATVENQPDRYEKLMATAAALDPSLYFSLGDFFKERQQNDKAASYFEKGSKLGPDSIRTASYASWRVHYYLQRGDKQKAREIADEAGEVYSFVGLEAKGEFLEATGDYPGAFEWYGKIQERYESAGPLVGFCLRYKARTGDSRYDAELKKRSAALFPKGIQKVALKDFKSAPTDGALIMGENALTREAGLNVGDVIVAVFGVRVHTFNQYGSARDFNSDPEMDLIVWQGNAYHEIKASPPRHRFQVDMVDFRPK
jgi:tetratricopeptide (TPR) repeat protein